MKFYLWAVVFGNFSLAAHAETSDCARGHRLVVNFCAQSGGQADELCRAGDDLVKTACGSGAPLEPTKPVWTASQPAPTPSADIEFGQLGIGSVIRVDQPLDLFDGEGRRTGTTPRVLEDEANAKMCFIVSIRGMTIPQGTELRVVAQDRKYMLPADNRPAGFWLETLNIEWDGMPSENYALFTCMGKDFESTLVSRELMPSRTPKILLKDVLRKDFTAVKIVRVEPPVHLQD